MSGCCSIQGGDSRLLPFSPLLQLTNLLRWPGSRSCLTTTKVLKDSVQWLQNGHSRLVLHIQCAIQDLTYWLNTQQQSSYVAGICLVMHYAVVGERSSCDSILWCSLTQAVGVP